MPSTSVYEVQYLEDGEGANHLLMVLAKTRAVVLFKALQQHECQV